MCRNSLSLDLGQENPATWLWLCVSPGVGGIGERDWRAALKTPGVGGREGLEGCFKDSWCWWGEWDWRGALKTPGVGGIGGVL